MLQLGERCPACLDERKNDQWFEHDGDLMNSEQKILREDNNVPVAVRSPELPELHEIQGLEEGAE